VRSLNALLSAVLLIAIVFGGVCCRPPLPAAPAPTPPAVLTSRDIAHKAESESVAVLSEHTGHAACGGVWVSPDTILTALHCVASNGKPTSIDDLLRQFGLENLVSPPWDPMGQAAHYKVSQDGESQTAMIVRTDADNDLALLKATNPTFDHAWARLSPDTIAVGDPVNVVGSTGGQSFTYSRGYVAAIRSAADTDHKFRSIQVSGPVYLGNSGGGAFDDNGDLLGIADFMIAMSSDVPPIPDVSFFVHRDVLREFLAS
jgi:S1-C subfamily serine protease